MLLSLHVKNLALVKEAEVEFENGLNILTGETGAGKSVILGSVNLALGGKASADIIGRYGDSALTELTFLVEDEERIEALRELGVEPEDGLVIISRKITSGRSVIKVNSETVTASAVRKITELLIDIHGQHDHQSLLYPQNHLKILDRFAKDELKPYMDRLSVAFKEYKDACRALDEFSIDEAERNREISYLQFEIDEIENADLKPGEDEQVEVSYRKMANSRKIADELSSVSMLLSSDGALSDAVGKAYSSLNSVVQYDDELNALLSQLADIDSLLSDFGRDMSDYITGLEYNEAEFSEVERRLDKINDLKAKYGQTIDMINARKNEAQKKLDFYSDYEANFEAAGKRKEDAYRTVTEICRQITSVRQKAATKLADDITKALLALNFEQVQFEIEIRPKDNPGADGADEAEFMISMNPGEPVRPLAKVASGGELSRIMLGIKSVLAGKDDIDTLIFDEIDTGISGRTAQKVAEKMALIAKEHQVLCITHLPQIAAMADTHFLIEKNVSDGFTVTSINRLDEESMVDELSRMLGGLEITKEVRDNAAQMKALAKKLK